MTKRHASAAWPTIRAVGNPAWMSIIERSYGGLEQAAPPRERDLACSCVHDRKLTPWTRPVTWPIATAETLRGSEP
jgi:hypothetical protein